MHICICIHNQICIYVSMYLCSYVYIYISYYNIYIYILYIYVIHIRCKLSIFSPRRSWLPAMVPWLHWGHDQSKWPARRIFRHALFVEFAEKTTCFFALWVFYCCVSLREINTVFFYVFFYTWFTKPQLGFKSYPIHPFSDKTW